MRSTAVVVLLVLGCGDSTTNLRDGSVPDGATDGPPVSDAAPSCTPGASTRTVVQIANGQDHPTAIAVDGSFVYWTNDSPTNGAVVKLSKLGGAPTPLASGQNRPIALAIDSTNVYWTNRDDEFNGTLQSAVIAGGASTPLASMLRRPLGVAVDQSYVYFTQETGAFVQRVPIGGGSAVTIGASNDPTAIVLDSVQAYWMNHSAIMKNAKAGGGIGTPVVDVGTSDVLQGMNILGSTLYFTTFRGTIQSVMTSGGASTYLASGECEPTAIVATSDSVYWVNRGTAANNYADGAIRRVGIGGGAVETIASSQNTPLGITADAAFVYWTNSGDGTVMKAPR